MIAGLLRLKLVEPTQIIASGLRAERGEELTERYEGIRTVVGNKETAKAGVLVLAVKPRVMGEMLADIKDGVSENTLVISIVAGIALGDIVKALGTDRIVRAMPNTPGRIGQGMTVWTCAKAVTQDDKERAKGLLEALGEELFVEKEAYLDMATALSGTGPAYAYLFMESLVDAGVGIGLPRHLAERMVLQTVLGSVAYARQSGVHLAQLRNEVTSPPAPPCTYLRWHAFGRHS
ncbi:MAG: pyrroline-5-carboxylate reductase [Parcubacteria group bacterium]